ncbi:MULTISPECIES: M15 family metallopeptidase [unclassified Nocardioides]|uniref:M15 family metallopeptidase n=1 Tax=unclassified Nocardioides TaxID=2615069 RepID=UPI0006FE3263|nr:MULTISPECIES: M15 family metallopeptidase [unclassified Nocardioides]KRA39168.1 peptidase M15 [Nocardioides sp. Root614]KRA93127.1 peptidase M15 [Nocardioides sp. Root682]
MNHAKTIAIGTIVVIAAIAVPLSQQVLGSTSSTITTPFDAFLGHDRGALGRDGGVVPDGVTVHDDSYPAVANLDSDLLQALRDAADDAAASGITFQVNSGWRSEAYQEQLLDDAVDEYGSREEAARWVATPETSAHVSGDAVDISQGDATTWLARHGSSYGLCQVYRNEPWHFELRPEARQIGCPRPYADPTEDPRLQQ